MKYIFEKLKYCDNKLIIKTKKKYLKTTDIKLLEKLIHNMFYNLIDVLYIEVEVNGNKRDVKTTINDNNDVARWLSSMMVSIGRFCGKNAPWHNGQDEPQPFAEPVFVTSAPPN